MESSIELLQKELLLRQRMETPKVEHPQNDYLENEQSRRAAEDVRDFLQFPDASKAGTLQPRPLPRPQPVPADDSVSVATSLPLEPSTPVQVKDQA